jgi:hypothetical protein
MLRAAQNDPSPWLIAFWEHTGIHYQRFVGILAQREAYKKTLGPTLAEQMQDPLFLKSLGPAKPFFAKMQTSFEFARKPWGAAGVFAMCTQCQEPVCEGKTRCELHLRLSNEAVKRSLARKRLEYPTLCLNCGNPASDGKRRWDLHLRLAREDYARKRLERPSTCLNCGNPASEGKTRCELHLRLTREAYRRWWMRNKANEQKTTPVRRPASSVWPMPQVSAAGRPA